MDQTNEERKTFMSVVLTTYGTEEQQKASVERFKEEVALQGFHASVTVICW